MLSSIHPLGERARNNRWGATATWYVVGSVVGGAALGLVAGVAGTLIVTAWQPADQTVAAAVAVVGVIALAVDASTWSLPTIHRQVNEDWLSYRSWVYGGGFGAQLGFGVVTIVPTAATYATIALAALTGSVVAAIGVGAWFGLARALPLLAVGRVRTADQLRLFHRRLQAAAPLGDRLVRAAAGAVAVIGLLGVVS